MAHSNLSVLLMVIFFTLVPVYRMSGNGAIVYEVIEMRLGPTRSESTEVSIGISGLIEEGF